MLVRFSFYDMIKIPEFSCYTAFELLDRRMDAQVAPFLWKLGANVDKGIRIQASRHRTVDLQSVVGYSYVCLERSDGEWLKDKNCSMSSRIHSQKDNELASDMVRMSMQGTSESKFIAMCIGAGGSEGTTRVVKKDEEPSWQDDLALMRTLRDIQKDVRGFIHPDEQMIDNEDDVFVDVANFETETKANY